MLAFAQDIQKTTEVARGLMAERGQLAMATSVYQEAKSIVAANDAPASTDDIPHVHAEAKVTRYPNE